MRELRFRAWDGKHMHEWGFIADIFVGPSFCGSENFKTMIHMQSTGLRDRNGKEIFEMDIFKHKNGETYKVNFRSGCFMADNICNGKSLRHDHEDVRVWHTLMESSSLIEIIGNIYESPTMVEGEEKP